MNAERGPWFRIEIGVWSAGHEFLGQLSEVSRVQVSLGRREETKVRARAGKFSDACPFSV
jgi:hypothetical protein